MKRLLLLITSFIPLIVIVLFSPSLSFAQTSPQLQKTEYYKATVITIEKDVSANLKNLSQQVKVRINEGPNAGKELSLEYGEQFIVTQAQLLKKGEQVIVSKILAQGKEQYSIIDTYRLPSIFYIASGFFLIVIFITGKKGLGAIAGMLLSVFIIFSFIVPQIMDGNDPLLISIVGSLVIMVATIYLAHGFTQQTSVAILATFLSLILTGLFAFFFVTIAKLSGLGSDDAYLLQQGYNVINVQGLLLGAIIIGTLGVLDDVTTTQVATIYTLAEAKPSFTIRQLFEKGMKIGREHIASLVNTLVLAYAGASIGVFIFLQIGIQREIQPLWVMLNNELIAEEIIRTLAGSLGLIVAVPLTTILAAFFSKYSLKIK